MRELKTALKPILRNRPIDLWDDSRIQAGNRWKREIEQAIRRASIAILLVSQQFLASDFITENELLPLLKAAERDGPRVLWIAVSASSYSETSIAAFQAVNNPARPLDSLRRGVLNGELVRIAGIIGAAIDGPDRNHEPQRLKATTASQNPQVEQISADPQVELQRFISNYGGELSRQSVEAVATDVQLKSIALTLATEVARSKGGTILGIGCGNGVLLERIAALEITARWVSPGAK